MFAVQDHICKIDCGRPVVGYEDRYSVTYDGRVYSLKKGIWLKPANTPEGYPAVNLRKNGTARTWRVGRLVAIAWIPNPNQLPVINHIDGDKENSSASNLEWCTQSHNALHAYATGLRGPASVTLRTAIQKIGLSNRRFTTEQIEEMRSMHAAGVPQRSIGEHFGAHQSAISRILNDRSYQFPRTFANSDLAQDDSRIE